MNFETKIALRYIFSKRSYNFISVITTISIIGIMIGVAALIAVLSIFNGFQDITLNQISGFDPHIRIYQKKGNLAFADSLNKKIKFNEKSSSAFVYSGKAIAMNGKKMQVFNLQSINSKDDDYMNIIKKNLLTGYFDLSENNNDKIVIGASLADKLRVLPGDTLLLFSPQMIERSFISYRIPQPIRVVVSGIFQINIKDYDISYAFVNSSAAQKLFRTKKYSFLDLRITNPKDVNKVKSIIENQIDDSYQIKSWIDLNKDIYSIMKFERMASFIIMSLIIIIAVFNILASLTMTVVEKQKDIAVLKSMGATDKSISKIFLTEGSIIGIISTISGVILGLTFCFGQIEYKWFKIDGSKYIIDAIPIIINYYDVVFIAMFSLLLSLIATIYPSKTAGKTGIAESLKSSE